MNPAIIGIYTLRASWRTTRVVLRVLYRATIVRDMDGSYYDTKWTCSHLHPTREAAEACSTAKLQEQQP